MRAGSFEAAIAGAAATSLVVLSGFAAGACAGFAAFRAAFDFGAAFGFAGAFDLGTAFGFAGAFDLGAAFGFASAFDLGAAVGFAVAFDLGAAFGFAAVLVFEAVALPAAPLALDGLVAGRLAGERRLAAVAGFLLPALFAAGLLAVGLAFVAGRDLRAGFTCFFAMVILVR
ncbi:MAG TPA: hypothetical protein VLG08_07310 [Casimicrobiaceae bacterium]|nr:hypothetical protein [Casimicrobiaceae bacterium]